MISIGSRKVLQPRSAPLRIAWSHRLHRCHDATASRNEPEEYRSADGVRLRRATHPTMRRTSGVGKAWVTVLCGTPRVLHAAGSSDEGSSDSHRQTRARPFAVGVKDEQRHRGPPVWRKHRRWTCWSAERMFCMSRKRKTYTPAYLREAAGW